MAEVTEKLFEDKTETKHERTDESNFMAAYDIEVNPDPLMCIVFGLQVIFRFIL